MSNQPEKESTKSTIAKSQKTLFMSSRGDHSSPQNSSLNPADEYQMEIDRALEGILAKETPEKGALPAAAIKISGEVSSTDPQELFCEIAAGYCQPLKNFIFEVGRGMGRRDWVEYCRPSLRAILNGVQQMGFPEETVTPIQCLDESLARLELAPSMEISPDLRTLILAQYEVLERRLPKIFKRGQSDSLREKMIIESLLLQLPGIGARTLNQLAAAGLASLHSLFMARAEELSAVAGISLAKAQKISNRLAQHRKWMESIPPDKMQESLLDYLRELTSKLKIWGRRRPKDPFSPTILAKREFPNILPTRENKRVTLMQARLVLAELNELGVLRRLDKIKTSTAILILEGFLS